PRAEELTVWDTTQAPIPIRNGLAQLLGLLESQVRVVAPFVGGGFGPKIMMFYPEEVLVPWAAVRLGRPVKWTEDRQENFFATTQERGQIHDAEMALTKDGRILGVRDVFLFDTGAYDPYGLTIPINSQCTLLGPYDIPSYESEFTAVFTNKTIVTPVRGAGRQHGVFVIERLLDFAAKELGIDRAEIRRRNLLRPDQFPFNNEILFHAAAVAVREKVLELASRELGAAPADLVLDGGRVHLRGDSGRGVALGALALKANPLRGAVRPGTEPGLEATAYFGPDRGSTANGVPAMVVEVDPETAQVEIKRYVVVHDCGRVLNPMIVEGQIHGGVAHGIGNAFYEQLVYDEE